MTSATVPCASSIIAYSLRFFALRMRGWLVKSDSQKLVAQVTELRFIVHRKRELRVRGWASDFPPGRALARGAET